MFKINQIPFLSGEKITDFMRQLNRQEKRAKIQQLFWDLSVDIDQIVRFLDGEVSEIKQISMESLSYRMLKSFSWYTLQKIVSRDVLRNMLDDRILSRLYPHELKNQYVYAREVLSR